MRYGITLEDFFKAVKASSKDEALDDCLLSPDQNSLPWYPCHLTVHPPHCMPMLSKFLYSWVLVNPFRL